MPYYIRIEPFGMYLHKTEKTYELYLGGKSFTDLIQIAEKSANKIAEIGTVPKSKPQIEAPAALKKSASTHSCKAKRTDDSMHQIKDRMKK